MGSLENYSISISFLVGFSGIINQAKIYAIVIGTIAVAKTIHIKIILTNVGSNLKYSDIPPNTPAYTLNFFDLCSLLYLDKAVFAGCSGIIITAIIYAIKTGNIAVKIHIKVTKILIIDGSIEK